MNKASKIFIILLTIGIFFSCKKPSNNSCIKGNGDIISEIRDLDSFNSLEINGNFKFTLKQDTVNKITIKSGENLVPFITTDVENNALIVGNKNKCRWIRSYDIPMEIELSFININLITINGQNDIFCTDTIRTDALFIDNVSDISTINLNIICNKFTFKVHAGSGDFTFNGIAKNSYYYFHGIGYIFANKLKSNYCEISSRNIGACYIYTTHTIIAELCQSGNIYYSGNPTNIKILKQCAEGKLLKY